MISSYYNVWVYNFVIARTHTHTGMSRCGARLKRARRFISQKSASTLLLLKTKISRATIDGAFIHTTHTNVERNHNSCHSYWLVRARLVYILDKKARSRTARSRMPAHAAQSPQIVVKAIIPLMVFFFNQRTSVRASQH